MRTAFNSELAGITHIKSEKIVKFMTKSDTARNLVQIKAKLHYTKCMIEMRGKKRSA